jgi:hypothetical protein
MKRETQYGVHYLGYSAKLIASKDDREIEYAHLDFVSGAVSLNASEGWILVPKFDDLGTAVASLSGHLNKLKQVIRRGVPPPATESGDFEIFLQPGADADRFCAEIAERFTEIQEYLNEAEEFGRTIKRRPYSEYLDEIERTGIGRVEVHGSGLFVDGKLHFFPDVRTELVKVERSPSGVLGRILKVKSRSH